VTLYGKNFGGISSELDVWVGGVKCRKATWFSDSKIECDTEPDVVGDKNVTLSVALQTAVITGKHRSECVAGYYGQVGEWCVECPEGAVCEGGLAEPYSKAAWWGTLRPTPDERCHELRQHREECWQFRACEPHEACTGRNQCLTTGGDNAKPIYTGDRCGECATSYYRVGGFCVPCPDNAWLLVIIFIAGLLALSVVVYVFYKYRISMAFLAIGEMGMMM
jgi:hypothetical protein